MDGKDRHCGCFRKNLNPLILSMKFTGLYFDADHFPTLKSHMLNNCGLNAVTFLRKDAFKNQVNVEKDEKIDFIDIPGWSTNSENSTSHITSRKTGYENDKKLYPVNPKNNYVPTLLRRPSGIMDEQELLHLVLPELSRKHAFQEDEKSPKHAEKLMNTVKSCLRFVFRGRIYSLLILLMFWANCFRIILYFGDSRVHWDLVATGFLWYLMTAMCVTSVLVSCWTKSHFSTFFINWTLLYKDNTTRELGLRGIDDNKVMKYLIALVWIATLMMIYFFIKVMVEDDDYSSGINTMLYVDGHRSIPSIIAAALINTYGSVAWYSCIVFIIIICRALVAHFNHFRETLRMHIMAAGNAFPAKLKELRERHVVMCNLTSVFDKHASVMMTVIISINILTSCLGIYHMIRLGSTVVFVMSSFSCIGILCVGFLVYNASKVHDAMHSVLKELQTIQTTGVTREQHIQLQLFMSQVNGPDLGLSILGLIIVKKDFLLTLFGLYITYVVVLLQFN